MAENIGSINVVFSGDASGVLGVISSLTRALDTAVAQSTSQAARVSTAVAQVANQTTASVASAAQSARAYAATAAPALQSVSVQINNVSAGISRRTREIAGSFSVLAGAVAAFSISSFVGQVGEYDRQLEAVRVLTRETAAEFQATRDAVLSLSQGLSVSAIDVAKGLNEIVQAGFTAADGLRVLEAAIKGARVGMTDTKTSSSALIQTLNAFGISAGDSEAVVGKLVRAVDLGVFSFERLATNVGQVAPLAKTIGLSIEELLGLLTSLTRKEANLDEVTTQVRAAFSDLLAPSDKARAAIEKVLGSTVEASVRTKGFAETLRLLVNSADGSASALATLFPNIRALSGLTKLTGDGFKEFTDDIKKLEGASVGSLNRALAVASRSFGSLVDQIKATASNSLVAYFERNRAAFVSYTEAIGRFLKENPEFLANTAKAVIGFAALAAAIGAVNVAISGLSILGSVVTGLGAAIKFAFGGEGLRSLVNFANKLDIILSQFTSFLGVASRTPAVVQGVINAQNAVAAATAAVSAAQNAVATSTGAATAASVASTLATDAATAASARLSAAKKAEVAAEDALTLAKQRQAVADARVAGLTFAAASKDPVTGRFKAASQGAANLLPAASKDLAAANAAVVAAEAELAAATAARDAALVKSVVSTRSLTAAEAELAAATNALTASQERLTAASAAASTATQAESAAMAELAAATGSVAAAQARVAAAQASAAGTGAAAAGAATAAGGAAAGLGATFSATAVGIASATAVLAGVLALFAAVGYAAFKLGGALYEYVYRPVLSAITGLDRFASSSEVASDDLLALVESQKKFNDEANRDAYAKRTSENEKAATDFTEKLQNLADLARSAAAGSVDAATKFAALSKEFEKGGGATGAAQLVDNLRTRYGLLAGQVQQAIDKQVALGDQGVQGLARVDEKTGEVVGTVANLQTVLAAAFGETKAREIVADLGVVKKQLDDVTKATQVYASAVHDLRTGNVSLAQAIKEAGKTIDEYADRVKKIGEKRAEAGLTGGQKEAKELEDERAALVEINRVLDDRARLIRETSIKGSGFVTDEAEGAVRAVLEEQRKVDAVLAENEKQFTKLFEAERAKRVAAGQEASDRIAEADIEVLKAEGDILTAELRSIDLSLSKRLRAIEAERRARVKAAQDAVGLADDERQREIDAVNAQADAEAAAAGRVADAKRDDAARDEDERRRRSEENKGFIRDEEEARKQVEAAKDAALLLEKARQAEINGEIEKRNDLMREYIKKLEEAGSTVAAQLAREREINRTASDRIDLLREEIKDRLRAGQGAEGVTEAARSAQSGLVGTNDVAGFRSGAREKLGQFNTDAEAKRFVDSVTEALKTEFDSLEVQRRDAINRGDRRTAEEIARRQEEVAVKYQALLEELARREIQIRNAPAPGAQSPGGPAPNGRLVPESTKFNPSEGVLVSDAGQGAGRQGPTAGSGLAGAAQGVADAATRLSGAVDSSTKSVLSAMTATAKKLDDVVKVLNLHSKDIAEVGVRVQRLRIVSVNPAVAVSE